MIKHISFDLWLTLIRSNPMFKRRRAELIAEMFKLKDFDVSQIEMLVRKQDKIFDKYNEITGKKIPAVSMYWKTLKKIIPHARMQDAEHLMHESNKLFLEYLPHILNDNISLMLETLKSEGKTLNISSNTGFIEGNTLREMLKKLDIYRYFSFFIFSDEINASKPSANFYQQISHHLNIRKVQVLHVGDNRKTDYEGAIQFGFNALLINNNYSIDDIRTKT